MGITMDIPVFTAITSAIIKSIGVFTALLRFKPIFADLISITCTLTTKNVTGSYGTLSRWVLQKTAGTYAYLARWALNANASPPTAPLTPLSVLLT
jgi:hypothetical protein